MRPSARGKLQDFRQFLGQTIDKNEAQKARLTELKSLKSIAQAYGISRAAAESLSYDDINAFVKRMEVERANETMREQQAVRQAQLAQARESRQASLEARQRATTLHERQQNDYLNLQAANRFMVQPGAAAPTQQGLDLQSQIRTAGSLADEGIELARRMGATPEQIAALEAKKVEQVRAFQARLSGPGMTARPPSPLAQIYRGRPEVQKFIRRSSAEGIDPTYTAKAAGQMAAALPDPELAARLRMGGAGVKPYYFSESEARSAYERTVAAQGITPTKANTDAFVASAAVKDLEKIRAAALKSIKRYQLDTAKNVLGTSELLEDLLKDVETDPDTGAVSSAGIKTLVARLFEPVGILTEDDKNQYAYAGGIKNKAAQAWGDIMSGSVVGITADSIRATIRRLEEHAKKTLREDSAEGIRFLADAYEISQEDVIRRTPFREYLLAPPGPQAPQAPRPPQAPGAVRTPSGGTFTPIP